MQRERLREAGGRRAGEGGHPEREDQHRIFERGFKGGEAGAPGDAVRKSADEEREGRGDEEGARDSPVRGAKREIAEPFAGSEARDDGRERRNPHQKEDEDAPGEEDHAAEDQRLDEAGERDQDREEHEEAAARAADVIHGATLPDPVTLANA